MITLSDTTRTAICIGWRRSIEDFTYNDTEMGMLFWNLTNLTSFEGVSVSRLAYLIGACSIYI